MILNLIYLASSVIVAVMIIAFLVGCAYYVFAKDKKENEQKGEGIMYFVISSSLILLLVLGLLYLLVK